MQPALIAYTQALVLRGDLRSDASALLLLHGCAHTIGHSARVAAEAERLATHYNLESQSAYQAAWLHDISAIVPNHKRIMLAEQLGVEILPEERQLPMIIHQKLSVCIAAEVFGIDHRAILSAIGCHTTLRAGASLLDMVVFVADKIAWDQPGDPPYLDAIRAASTQSLPAAALVYLRYLWERRATLAVVHPWLVAAYQELSHDH